MQFRILGPLEVEAEGRVLKLGGAKPRGLLALLLLHANEAVSRDRLMSELWGDDPPETAATAIQVHVSQLRKVLGPDVIVTKPPGYLIRTRDGELDLERFEQAVARARTAEATEAAELLREALLLWRGHPLADLDASLGRGERARLEEQWLAALEQRIDADLELGRHAELVPELEGLVREHPLRERLRGQLMLALYRCGRQADALEVYRSGRRVLDEELGLEPGEELRRLERAILAQDDSLAAPAAAAKARPAQVPTGTVTFLFSDIEGSTRLVQELGDEYGELIEQHQSLLQAALEEHGGEAVTNQADAFFFAFRRARDAVEGAIELQKSLAQAPWPGGATVRVRVGIHTGEPGIGETGYHGLDVVRAARISGAAHGGQILISSATRDLVGAALKDVSFDDLGPQRLKDLDRPERIFQVVAAGLPASFPPPATADSAHVMTIRGREGELAAAAEAVLETEERRARLFRRSRVIAGVGALLLAGAIAGVAIALTSGSGGAVDVVPNSIAVVDTEHGKLVADVPLGGRPVDIAVGDDAVWATNADDGTLSRIDPDRRRVVKTIGLGADVNYVDIGFGSVWVAGGNDETLFRIDPERNAVEATLRFGDPDPLRPKPVFFVVAGREAVWITRGDSVLRIDPATNSVTKRVELPTPAIDLGAGQGNVWVTTRDERLVRIDEGSAAISARESLPSLGASPVVAAGALWLIEYTETPQVGKLDPGTVTQLASIPFRSSFIAALAADEGVIWAADHASSRIWRIDPDTVRAVPVVKVGHHPIAVAAGHGAAWVGVQEQRFS
jgi:DNA-binding SARP family transcriptional activator/streptogramin lyase